VSRALADRDLQVTTADLTAHERRHGRIKRGTIALLRTATSAIGRIVRGTSAGSDKIGGC
jgi:hypothetical protein